MADNFINITNSTIVTGVTSTQDFLTININNRNVGIPLYTFEVGTTFPEIDFIDLLSLDLTITDATLVTNATSYGAGIALSANKINSAWPIYKIDQTDIKYDIKADTPTLVSDLSSRGQYVAVNINNTVYGIPLFDYSSQFPFASSEPMSGIKVNTKMFKPIKRNIDGAIRPSTNLNSKIKTYENLINRIKYQLGEPFINIEVCDDTQMVDFIDKALEWYTKYAGFTEEFLIFSSTLYTEPGLKIDKLFTLTPAMREAYANGATPSWDYDLGDYRKVVGVFSVQQGETTGINTLFTLEQSMAQQTYFSYMLGNAGFDLVTWECLKGWLDLREKMLAQTPYIDFNERTQTLRVIPAPTPNSRYVGVVGCWVEKPVADLLAERWIQEYTLALTKIAIGYTRGKYQGQQFLGGGSLMYNELLQTGLEDKKRLEEEIQNGYGEVTPARFFLG